MKKEDYQKVNKAIIHWLEDKPGLVVAIDGYTGIGKTTLVKNLVALNTNIIAVHRDAFLFSKKIIEEKLSKAQDKSVVFEQEVYDDQKLIDLISAFKNKEKSVTRKVMVVEGVFMFHPKSPLNKLWDKRIYLKGDIDQIDKRRIEREKQRWGKEYFPETHPDSYFKQVTSGLNRYIELYRPQEVADLILDVA